MSAMRGLVFCALLAVPATAGAQPEELKLSLEDAVARAMENNADIAIQKLSPEISGQTVREIEGAYDVTLTADLLTTSRTSPASNVFAGAENVDTDTLVFNFGASRRLETGGFVDVLFDNSRAETNNVFSTFNPSYNSALDLRLTQPLLRNLWIDSTRRQLRVAKNNLAISDYQFRQTVVNTLANVKDLYYEFLYAIDSLEAARQNLALAQKFLEENQIKVRVGTLAPLDVVAAESEVATREEAVILAETALGNAEDALKRTIFPSNDPNMWRVRLVPSDRPTAEPVTVDVDQAVARALENRTDVRAARKNLESADVSLSFGRNQRLPAVDLVATYGSSGIGGTQLVREDPLGPVVDQIPGGYGNAAGDAFGRDFPTWTVGVNVSIPIPNRTGSAQAARLRVSRDQTEMSLHRLETAVAAEVRSAARAVEANFKRVESTRAARTLQERRLDAETKKFDAGMSTNFLVTQAQRDLAVAQVAELRAIADYRRSLVAFERAQEAGLGGGNGSFSVNAQ